MLLEAGDAIAARVRESRRLWRSRRPSRGADDQTDATHFISVPHNGDCGLRARSRSSPF